MTRSLLDQRQVAELLHLSQRRFADTYETLRKDGFPESVFGVARGRRWDPKAIERWLDAKIAPVVGPGDTTMTIQIDPNAFDPAEEADLIARCAAL